MGWGKGGVCVETSLPSFGFFLAPEAKGGETSASRRGEWTSTYALNPSEQEDESEGSGRAEREGSREQPACTINIVDDV